LSRRTTKIKYSLISIYLSSYFGLVLQISISDEHEEIWSSLNEFIFLFYEEINKLYAYIYNHLVKLSSNQSISDDVSNSLIDVNQLQWSG
jgi:hypothetical protein